MSRHLHTASYGKPGQQRFTVRSGVLPVTCSRRRGAVSGRPLPERTDFGPIPQPAALWPSPRTITRQRLAISVPVAILLFSLSYIHYMYFK